MFRKNWTPLLSPLLPGVSELTYSPKLMVIKGSAAFNLYVEWLVDVVQSDTKSYYLSFEELYIERREYEEFYAWIQEKGCRKPGEVKEVKNPLGFDDPY